MGLALDRTGLRGKALWDRVLPWWDSLDRTGPQWDEASMEQDLSRTGA